MLSKLIKNKFFFFTVLFFFILVRFYFYESFSNEELRIDNFYFSSFKDFSDFLSNYDQNIKSNSSTFPNYSVLVSFDNNHDYLGDILQKNFKYTKEVKLNSYMDWKSSNYYNSYLRSPSKLGGYILNTLSYDKDLGDFNIQKCKTEVNLIYKDKDNEVIRLRIDYIFSNNFIPKQIFDNIKKDLRSQDFGWFYYDCADDYLIRYKKIFCLKDFVFSKNTFEEKFIFKSELTFWLSKYNRFMLYNKNSWEEFISLVDSYFPEKLNKKVHTDIKTFIKLNKVQSLRSFYRFSSFYVFDYKKDGTIFWTTKYAGILNSDKKTLHILEGESEFPFANHLLSAFKKNKKYLYNPPQFDFNQKINTSNYNFFDQYVFSDHKQTCIDKAKFKFSKIRIFGEDLFLAEFEKYNSNKATGSIIPCDTLILHKEYLEFKKFWDKGYFDKVNKGSIICCTKNIATTSTHFWVAGNNSLGTCLASNQKAFNASLDDLYYQIWYEKHKHFIKNRIFVKELNKYNVFTENLEFINPELSYEDRFQTLLFYELDKKNNYLNNIKNIYGSTKNRGEEFYFNNINDANKFIKKKNLLKIFKAVNLVFYNKNYNNWEIEDLIIFEDTKTKQNVVLIVKSNNLDKLKEHKLGLELMCEQMNYENFNSLKKKDFLIFSNYSLNKTNSLIEIDPTNTLLNYKNQYGIFYTDSFESVFTELNSLKNPLDGNNIKKSLDFVDSFNDILFDLVPNFHYLFTLDNFINFKYFIIHVKTIDGDDSVIKVVITDEKIYVFSDKKQNLEKLKNCFNNFTGDWTLKKNINLIKDSYEDIEDSCVEDLIFKADKDCFFYFNTKLFYTPSLKAKSYSSMFSFMLSDDHIYPPIKGVAVNLNDLIADDSFFFCFDNEEFQAELLKLNGKGWLKFGQKCNSLDSLYKFFESENLTIKSEVTAVTYSIDKLRNNHDITSCRQVVKFIWLREIDYIYSFKLKENEIKSMNEILKVDDFLKKEINNLSKDIKKQKFLIPEDNLKVDESTASSDNINVSNNITTNPNNNIENKSDYKYKPFKYFDQNDPTF